MQFDLEKDDDWQQYRYVRDIEALHNIVSAFHIELWNIYKTKEEDTEEDRIQYLKDTWRELMLTHGVNPDFL